MKLLTNIAITLLATAFGFVGMYNYAPQESISIGEPTLGATVTTIQGSDTLKNSRTVINTNFSNLNTDLIATIATTSMAGLTTAENLVTVGTIGTGVWQGTTIDELYGGTGFATYATGDLIYASGVNTLSKLTASSTNEVLTLIGGVPVWKDAPGVDVTSNFTWTGDHVFQGLFTTTNATSTTFNSPTLTSTTFTNSGTASTTDLIVSGDCTGCVTDYEITTNTGTNSTSGTKVSATASCSAGNVVVGGGITQGGTCDGTGSQGVNDSGPSGTTGWTASTKCASGSTGDFTVHAICVKP